MTRSITEAYADFPPLVGEALRLRIEELATGARDLDGIEVPYPDWPEADLAVQTYPHNLELGNARGPDSWFRRLDWHHRIPTNPKGLGFLCNCVDWPKAHVADLTRLCDNARSITRETFTRNVSLTDLRALERQLGYIKGRSMAQDYHVTYHSGRLFRAHVYFLRWSAIEYVFGPDHLRGKLGL